MNTAALTSTDSPYVGPRPFRRGELFFGRDREAAGLVQMLIGSRIVLLHSPSGAGKTSLIQAAVEPAMNAREFQSCPPARPFSAVRVSAPLPDTLAGTNRYVMSTVSCLVGHLPDVKVGPDWSISRALDRLAAEPGAASEQFLVVDQFEEILTKDPTDFEGQRGFFLQLGEALEKRNRWALLAMREDYMGGLDRFLRYIPGQLRATYRLDLLDRDAALRAIQEPAKTRGVDFTPSAASKLVIDLQRVRTGDRDATRDRPGIYVEPVFLQVVCESLWQEVHKGGAKPSAITDADLIAFGPLNSALGRYYAAVVNEAAGRDESIERAIREWVRNELLTDDGFLRSQTRVLPRLPGHGDPDSVMRVLQDRYLIRSEQRTSTVWWELSHDRLNEPIIEDNRAWRGKHLEPWQRSAYDWRRGNRDTRYLIDGEQLRAARAARRAGHLTDDEEAFLAASEAKALSNTRLRRAQAFLDRLAVLLVISLVLNAVLLVILLTRH